MTAVVCDVALCSLIEHQCYFPDDGGSKDLLVVGKFYETTRRYNPENILSPKII
jgi:hypothetical protein